MHHGRQRADAPAVASLIYRERNGRKRDETKYKLGRDEKSTF
jgi:hypothetical protein